MSPPRKDCHGHIKGSSTSRLPPSHQCNRPGSKFVDDMRFRSLTNVLSSSKRPEREDTIKEDEEKEEENAIISQLHLQCSARYRVRV